MKTLKMKKRQVKKMKKFQGTVYLIDRVYILYCNIFDGIGLVFACNSHVCSEMDDSDEDALMLLADDASDDDAGF